MQEQLLSFQFFYVSSIPFQFLEDPEDPNGTSPADFVSPSCISVYPLKTLKGRSVFFYFYIKNNFLWRQFTTTFGCLLERGGNLEGGKLIRQGSERVRPLLRYGSVQRIITGRGRFITFLQST